MIAPEVIIQVIEKFGLKPHQYFEHIHLCDGSRCTISQLYISPCPSSIPYGISGYEISDPRYILFMHLPTKELATQIIEFLKDLEVLFI